MTAKIFKIATLCCALAAIVAACALLSSSAEARGIRAFYSQDYKLESAMRGFLAQQGANACSYQRLANRLCDRKGENCTITGWTLREYCN